MLNDIPIEINNLKKKNSIQHKILENGKKLSIMGKNSANYRYTCVVTNKVGTATKDFIVKVSFTLFLLQ